MKTDIRRCPLLRDEKVIYCRNFPMKKMLPVDRVFEKENLCLQGSYRLCPFFEDEKIKMEHDVKVCPFVRFEVISFCMAFPLKKIVTNHIMASPCNSNTYETCPFYKKAAGMEVEEKSVNLR